MATTDRQTDGQNRIQEYEYDYNGGTRSSRELERDIERTRHQMDETLDQIGERLHPKHLLDEVLDLFRSGDHGSAKRDRYIQQARSSGKQIAHKIRQHPVPALLAGAGLAWLIYEELMGEDEEDLDTARARMRAQWDDIPEHSGSFVDARTGEPYDESYGEEWKGVAPWSEGYEWSGEDEATWSQRAGATLEDLKHRLADSSLSARDKIQHVASKLMGLSGRKRRDLSAQWATLAQRSAPSSGLGAPYHGVSTKDYSRELRDLCACDFAASHDWSAEDEEGWTEKAQHMLDEIQATLSNTTSSAKDRMKALAGHIGDFVGSTRDMSAHYGGQLRRQGARLGRSTRRAVAGMQHQFQNGYVRGRDGFAHAVEESPMAVGAAFLGLGLIAGMLLPSTRREDELMGEASDQLKHQVKETGQDVLRRGRHVAKATASAAAEQLEKEGLTPEQLAEKARHVAEATSERANQTVRDEATNAQQAMDLE